MKTPLLKKSILWNFVSLCIFLSCGKESDQLEIKNGKISFSLSTQEPSNSGGRTTESVDPSYINITVLKAGGTYYNDARYYRAEVIKVGTKLFSSPIELPSGSYDLAGFNVMGSNGNYLYGVPVTGTPMAHLVQNPLPYRVEALPDESITLPLEVLPISDDYDPEDFGYSAFNFNVIEAISFQIAVFVYNEASSNFELATSALTVTSNGTNLYQGDLSAATNKVYVRNLHANFDVVVSKPGYTPYSVTLTEGELKSYEPNTIRSTVLMIRLTKL